MQSIKGGSFLPHVSISRHSLLGYSEFNKRNKKNIFWEWQYFRIPTSDSDFFKVQNYRANEYNNLRLASFYPEYCSSDKDIYSNSYSYLTTKIQICLNPPSTTNRIWMAPYLGGWLFVTEIIHICHYLPIHQNFPTPGSVINGATPSSLFNILWRFAIGI